MPSFPQRYAGTFSHPDLPGELEITVVRKDEASGTWTAAGETKKIEVKEKEGKIGFKDEEDTVMIGEADSSGVIKGEVLHEGKGGGTFTLKPQEESSAAGSPVKAVKALRKKGAPGDEYRALSVWFIINKLMDDLGAKDDSKVYNVEPRIREKGAEADCPRDGRKGTAYVDVADDPYAGYATHMLSYTWGYYLKEIKDTLQRFCQDGSLDIKEVRVWMCFACVNQHRVKEAQAKKENIPFEAFQKIFGERVQNIGHILPMMSPWNAPFYITRVWCCFEIYTAVNLGPEKCKVTVLLPPKQSSDFSEAFDKGAEKMVFQALRSIDVENAQASMPEDKEQILRLIKEGPGYHKVNTQVVKHLRNWFMLEACRNECDRLCKLGRVYTTFGRYDAGIDMIKKAGDLLDKLNDESSPLAVRVLVNLAEAEFMQEFYNGKKDAADVALERYAHAQKMVEKLGMGESELAVIVHNKIGITIREKANNIEDEEEQKTLRDKAVEGLKKGQAILKKLGGARCAEGMWNTFIHGLVLGDSAKKDDEKALKAAQGVFEEAITLGKALELTKEEYYVKGVHAYALHYAATLDDMDGALPYYEEAKVGYEALGMTDSNFYLMCSIQIGMCLVQGEKCKDLKAAAICFQDCLEAAESSGNDEVKVAAETVLKQVTEALEAED